MKQFLKYSLILFITIVFSNCNYPRVEKEAPFVNEVPANSKFCIILPENHTTGYLWQLSHDYDESAITHLNEVWHGNEKGIYFNLNALSVGQTTLNFVSRKYQDTAEIRHFIVKIESH